MKKISLNARTKWVNEKFKFCWKKNVENPQEQHWREYYRLVAFDIWIYRPSYYIRFYIIK